MPKVLPDRIIFDQEDFVQGLAPNFGSGAVLTIGPGASFLQNFNPFSTSGLVGAAAPGGNPADVTTVSVIDAIQIGKTLYRGSTNYLYTVGGTKIHQLNASNTTFTNNATFPMTVSAHASHGAVTLWDVVLYTHKVSSSNRTDIFYSWDDVNDGDVGIFKASDGTAANTSYMSATPSGAARLIGNRPHPLIIGDDGIMYIGNGNNVASLDGQTGADGTFSSSALDLPPDFVITGFAKDSTKNLLVIYAYNPVGNTPMAFPDGDSTYKGEAFAFFWDYVSQSFIQAISLDDNYVNGGFNYKGIPGCFTWGRGQHFSNTNNAKLRLFNGRGFEILAKFSGNPPSHGGVEIYGDVILWNADGKIWQYGSLFSGFPKALFHITTGGGTTNGGVLINLSANNLYASTGTTTSGGFQKVSPANYNTGSWSSLTVEPPLLNGHLTEVTNVKTFFAGTATGGRSLALTLTTDKSNTTTTVFTGVTDVTVPTTAESATSKKLVTEANLNSSGTPFPVFGDLRTNLTWSTGSGATAAPQVNRIEVFYKPIALT